MARRLIAVAAVTLALGCSVGDGLGTIRGSVYAPSCGVDLARYDMHADFFASEWDQGSFAIHITHGGNAGDYNDELMFRVQDTAYVASHLNERMAVGPAGAAPVQAVLRLDRSCGRVEITEYAPVVGLEAYEGYVVFREVYRGSPNADSTGRLTDVSEFSIRLRDPRTSLELRNGHVPTGSTREPAVLPPATAELEGSFQFYFARGRPAQWFQ